MTLKGGLTHHLFENPALPVYNYESHVWNYFQVLRLLQSLISKDVDNWGKPNYLHLKAEVGQIFISGEPGLDRLLSTTWCFSTFPAWGHDPGWLHTYPHLEPGQLMDQSVSDRLDLGRDD